MECSVQPASRDDTTPTIGDVTTLNSAVLAEGLVKSFGDVNALAGVTFEVPSGTVLGLLGPNGAGKTTAVRILTTILQPDGGRASVAGHDVVREPQAVRRSIGLAGQYAAVDENLTGRENLVLVGRLSHIGKALRARASDARCSTSSTSPTPATGRCARTRVGCVADSTSPRRS